jgi:hypothetical protein
MRDAHDGTPGLVVEGGIRQPQHVPGQAHVLQHHFHQFLTTAAIQIQRSSQDLGGVIAERWHTLTIGNLPYAKFQLLRPAQPAAGIELGFVGNIAPASLFGQIGTKLNGEYGSKTCFSIEIMSTTLI